MTRATPRHHVSRWIGVALALVAVASAAPAAAASMPPQRTLAVSVPPEPTQVRPGQAAMIPIRVINAGSRSVEVTVTSRGVDLGDDGAVHIEDKPDPRWQGRVSFPMHPQQLAPRSFATMVM